MNMRICIALAAIVIGCMAIGPLVVRRQFRAESEFRKGFKTKATMESMVWLVYERRNELEDFGASQMKLSTYFVWLIFKMRVCHLAG